MNQRWSMAWMLSVALLFGAASWGCSSDGDDSADASSETESSASESPDEEGADDEDAAGEEGDEEDTGEPTLSNEDCDNGEDDDGDGLIDCADDDCATNTDCVELEICDNDGDDNGNGLTDCDDPYCLLDSRCAPPCPRWFHCLAQEVLPCTVGTDDCPGVGSDDYVEAWQSCLANEACEMFCDGFVGPEEEAIVDGYINCVVNQCGGDLGDGCNLGACLQQWAPCYYEGEDTCNTYDECIEGCPTGTAGAICEGDCEAAASPAGIIDFVGKSSCVSGQCNVDDNNDLIDSIQCENLATELVCTAIDSSCTAPDLYSDEQDCAGLFSCLADCESFGNLDCVQACSRAVSLDVLGTAAPVASCVISACGTGADRLNPDCLFESAFVDCLDEMNACQGGPFFEVCFNAQDDDQDGNADCDDDECTENDACKASVRMVHMIPGAPNVAATANGDVIAPTIPYGKGIAYELIKRGLVPIGAVPSDDTEADPIANVTALLVERNSYSVVLVGTPDEPDAILLNDNREDDVIFGNLHLRVVHTAPGVGEASVSASSEADGSSTVDGALGFGEASNYLALPVTEEGTAYTIEVDLGGGTVLEAELPALTSGIVITGFIGEQTISDSGYAIYLQFEDGAIATYPLVAD